MRLIGLAVVLAVSLTLAPLAAEAQQTEKISRIGFMSVSSREPAKHLISIFFEAMRERGWVEGRGRNLFIEWRWAEGMVERLPDFAAELVQLNADLIVAPETSAALAAKHATRTIPVVFVFARDPVADNLVASFARPGGNATGLTTTPTLDIYGKQLELLKETVPQASRVAVLWSAASSARPEPSG
jgi:putative ABC transport system substrate-binding protein